MDILELGILIFVILELANVIILYFKPEFKYGNGVSSFKQWNESKKDENTYLFAKYLVNWVAGTKLIFITLLIVILIFGNEITKIFSIIAIIFSILTYYIKLSPIMNKLDKNGQIQPKNYSKTLFMMITLFITMFLTVLVIYMLK